MQRMHANMMKGFLFSGMMISWATSSIILRNRGTL
jgi:hypothetical protein